MQIGYFGIILPQQQSFNGFFLHDDQFAEAQAAIENLRDLSDASYMPISSVVRNLPDLSKQDQMLVGAFSAALVETYRLKEVAKISVFAQAMYLVTKRRYFIVTGDVLADGTSTTIDPLPDATCDEDVKRALSLSPTGLAHGLKMLMRGIEH